VLKQVPTNELELALPKAMENVTVLLGIKQVHVPDVGAILNTANDEALKQAHIRRLAEYRNEGNPRWYRDPALLIDVPLQVLIRCQKEAQRPVRKQQQAGEATTHGSEDPTRSPSAAPHPF
jgi:hypothetical protein